MLCAISSRYSLKLPDGRDLFWLILLAALAGFAWRMLRKPGSGFVPSPLQGKAAQLRETWRKLADEELDAKEFCLGLSNLARECLEYRYGFPAVDLTTEEIFQEVEKHKLSSEEKTAVEKCLKTCDRDPVRRRQPDRPGQFADLLLGLAAKGPEKMNRLPADPFPAVDRTKEKKMPTQTEELTQEGQKLSDQFKKVREEVRKVHRGDRRN